jgi:hypothetical protein
MVFKLLNSDSNSDEALNVATKTRNLDQKLTEISSKGQKPTINAIAQGFQPSRKALAAPVNKQIHSNLILHSK